MCSPELAASRTGTGERNAAQTQKAVSDSHTKPQRCHRRIADRGELYTSTKNVALGILMSLTKYETERARLLTEKKGLEKEHDAARKTEEWMAGPQTHSTVATSRCVCRCSLASRARQGIPFSFPFWLDPNPPRMKTHPVPGRFSWKKARSISSQSWHRGFRTSPQWRHHRPRRSRSCASSRMPRERRRTPGMVQHPLGRQHSGEPPLGRSHVWVSGGTGSIEARTTPSPPDGSARWRTYHAGGGT